MTNRARQQRSGPAPPRVRASKAFWLAPSLVAAAGWAGLAAFRPTTTWHLGPVIVVAAAPVAVRIRTAQAVDRSMAWRVVLAASSIVLLETLALSESGYLTGPTAIDRGSALSESVVFALVGALWAFRVATRVKTSWWLRLLQGSEP